MSSSSGFLYDWPLAAEQTGIGLVIYPEDNFGRIIPITAGTAWEIGGQPPQPIRVNPDVINSGNPFEINFVGRFRVNTGAQYFRPEFLSNQNLWAGDTYYQTDYYSQVPTATGRSVYYQEGSGLNIQGFGQPTSIETARPFSFEYFSADQGKEFTLKDNLAISISIKVWPEVKELIARSYADNGTPYQVPKGFSISWKQKNTFNFMQMYPIYVTFYDVLNDMGYVQNGVIQDRTNTTTTISSPTVSGTADLTISTTPTPTRTKTPTPTRTPSKTPSVTPTITPSITPSVTLTPSISVTPSVTPQPSRTPDPTPSAPAAPVAGPPLQGGPSEILPFLYQEGGTTDVILGKFDTSAYNSQVQEVIGGGTKANTELTGYHGIRAKEIQGWFAENTKFLLYSGVSLFTLNSTGNATFTNPGGVSTLLISPEGSLTHPGNISTGGNTTIKGILDVNLTTRIGGVLTVNNTIISDGTIIASGLDLVSAHYALSTKITSLEGQLQAAVAQLASATTTAQSSGDSAQTAAEEAQKTADAAMAAAMEAQSTADAALAAAST
jgi:hypothetical protein